MEEKVYEVEMMYIQNTSGTNYTLETMGRRTQSVKLNFSKVEGVEFSPAGGLEFKHAFLQMAEGESKVMNMRFPYPKNFKIKYIMGKIIIETI